MEKLSSPLEVNRVISDNAMMYDGKPLTELPSPLEVDRFISLVYLTSKSKLYIVTVPSRGK